MMEMRDTLRFFFSFRGRISRSRFWLGFLMLTALELVLLAPFLLLDIPEEGVYKSVRNRFRGHRSDSLVLGTHG